jgi:ADP-heptose:LPS heptosyltransferase
MNSISSTHASTRAQKRLIIRLSSFGDVILATSALSALQEGENHWVVSREYASLLRGHPKLKKVWEYDRQNGLLGWFSLCEKLWKEDFSEVLDLHSTLRSWIARVYFWIRGKIDSKNVVWKKISKERLRLFGMFSTKRLWPKSQIPHSVVERFASLAGGTGRERPDLKHLIAPLQEVPSEFISWARSHEGYVCVMPSSKWSGKKWSVRGFFEVISKSGVPAVVLGEKSDRESALLAKLLEQAGLTHFSGVGKFDFRSLAYVLSRARVCLGNDTGVAHLAEAVGTRVVTAFGPTVPEMGFGPWRKESRAVGSPLWCRPCGKDGRYCFRLNDRYACQSKLSPAVVLKELESSMNQASRGLE